MQFNESGSSLQSEINITPLVDVVLVLLIIFMVVVPLLMEGYDVDSPRASAEASAQLEEKQLILSIGSTDCPLLTPPAEGGIPRDCQVILADQKIPAVELPARVAQFLGGFHHAGTGGRAVSPAGLPQDVPDGRDRQAGVSGDFLDRHGPPPKVQ